VIEKVGLDIAKEVIKHRAFGQKITEILGGKPTHPVSGIPGGQTKGLNEEERKSIEEMATSCVGFAEFSLKLFADVVLRNGSGRREQPRELLRRQGQGHRP
jgi:F420-non-reducing hydrogenase large subunit